MGFNPFFTKAKPRILDYDPILHTSFYNRSPNRSLQPTINHNTYKQNNAYGDRSYSSMEFYNRRNQRSPMMRQTGKVVVQNQRLYKTRPKNIFSDPITGVVKQVNATRNDFQSLDVVINKPRFNRNSYSDSPQFGRVGEKDRISGALRKEVPETTYVNPYYLKHFKEARLDQRPDFQRAAMKFYGN